VHIHSNTLVKEVVYPYASLHIYWRRCISFYFFRKVLQL